MTREEAKEFYPILQAYAEGKVIECRTKPSAIEGTDVPNDWTEMKEIEFWRNIEYRIKSEPKYRPFKTKEECWNEMHKHPDFGWLIKMDTGIFAFVNIKAIFSEEIVFDNDFDNVYTFKNAFKYYKFTDGTPFGSKLPTNI